jgi:hypothetical protein
MSEMAYGPFGVRHGTANLTPKRESERRGVGHYSAQAMTVFLQLRFVA